MNPLSHHISLNHAYVFIFQISSRCIVQPLAPVLDIVGNLLSQSIFNRQPLFVLEFSED
jgi:hypothetical protein